MNDDVSGELKILFEYSVGDSRLCQNLLGQLSETKGGDGVEQQRAVLILLNVGKFRADLKYGKNYPLFLAGRAGNIQIMGILLRFGAVLKHNDSEAGDVLGHARSVINEGMKMRMLEVFFFFFFFFFFVYYCYYYYCYYGDFGAFWGGFEAS